VDVTALVAGAAVRRPRRVGDGVAQACDVALHAHLVVLDEALTSRCERSSC